MSGGRKVSKTLSLSNVHAVIDGQVKLASEPSCDLHESFDDALHTLVNATQRPKTEADICSLCSLIMNLMKMCGDDVDGKSMARWTSFTLSIIHRRYHLRAPEAREEKLKAGEDASIATGDGERLFFYVTVVTMLKYSMLAQKLNDKSGVKGEKGRENMINNALECLFCVAPHAGGSRDICALIEFGIYDILYEMVQDRNDQFSPLRSLSTSELTGWALRHTTKLFKEEEKNSYHLIEELISLAAKTLDSDFAIVTKDVKSKEEEEQKIMSTLNTFLPHHDRGRQSGKKRRRDGGEKPKMTDRNLVQCISELLIWSKTEAASTDDGVFSVAFDDLLQRSKSPEEVLAMRGTEDRERHKSTIKSSLHKMQAIARRQRKVLNTHARSKGYMLSDLYVLDSQSISLGMIKRGKAGDLSRLTALAGKSGGTQVLEMINMRNTDPSKAVPMESLRQMKRDWVPLDGENEDEVRAIKLKLQEAMVWSTLKRLRKSQYSSPSTSSAIASLDQSKLNHAASVLMGAAMGSWVDEKEDPSNAGKSKPQPTTGDDAEDTSNGKEHRVYIKDRLVDVGSFDLCMKNLNDVFTSPVEEASVSTDAAATTKDVLNLIDRHILDGDVLVLFTSADLQLPDYSLSDIQKRGCSIHCHKADDLTARLEREGAQTGDVTVSLMWDTGDDLDLHIVMPSGEEITYCNKRSICGLGCLDVDMNAGGATSTEPVENVFLGKPDECIEAPKGKYKVIVQNYAYHASKSGTPVEWRVTVRMNGGVREYAGKCVGTGAGSNSIACEFDYAGRTIPFEKELENKSAFGTANLVSVTASTGQTLESLCQLMTAAEEHGELGRVRDLVADEDGSEGNTEDGGEEETEEEKDEGANDNAMDVEKDESEAGGEGSSESAVAARPLVAAHGTLEVTSRDRLHTVLCKLPKRFHDEVKRCLGGGETLVDMCAADVARRMLKDNVRLSDLRSSGYPPEVVEKVSSIMRKGAVGPAV
uniref:Uncharacterized protein n=1 Tax=Odontella aurita TaxID=265563 RepID=A0A7S4NG04_9STRA|mmetsp:Transcript_62201/g.183940  ORF Transcript_62201/g.183940 Transcript_62201/m.183940 type:complete len:985 (+) Transcript_62201:130-3084(+)|eukprot:CAMPEP_0113545948 /NCGR_PEP_ID=MMETSP0015_2-20120614/11542_1 /TAXON_ID=2838 /ORGANISM="Odontella" /LENGTH=984 /DNA_ID=CAMNT_0000446365 /DNA_START=130 /DNA_END=3084 /DNA_ORIENTATION=+ /assembly_acc=CAM_ASM_000160